MWGAIIPAAASLIGGYLARSSAEDQQQANLDAQREFAQHGIRWKVADAKAAGVHPVYALGASGSSYTPSPIIIDPMAEAISQMGQSVGQYFRAPANRNQEVRGVPPSSSSLGYDMEDAAMAADYGWSSPSVARVSDPDFGWDAWRFEQPKIPSARSGDPSTEAGPARPGMVEYELRPGFRMKFPSGSSFSEALESLENPLMWPSLIKLNVEHYGVGWLDDFGKSLVPGYATIRDVGEKIGGEVGRLVHLWNETRRAALPGSAQRSQGKIGGEPYRRDRNRITGRIRGNEPTRPSEVPGYRGSW